MIEINLNRQTSFRDKAERAKKSLSDSVSNAASSLLAPSDRTASFVITAGVYCGVAAFNTVSGACVGEIMDHVPYVNTAIPDALQALTHSPYFHGNLDKLGALAGFISSFYVNSKK